MTRAEAEKELAEVDPKEAEAWKIYSRIVSMRDIDIAHHEDSIRHIRLKSDEALRRQNAEWMPLYIRQRELKTFLERPPAE